jgi:RecA-family ATPase
MSGRLQPLAAVPASELLAKELPNREWLVPHFIPRRVVTILSGDGGTGKTLLALQLAVACTTGKRWLGLDVENGGKALVLSAEDELAELGRRIRDIAAGDGLLADDLGDLFVKSLASDENPSLVELKGSRVERTNLCKQLEAQIDQLRPRVVILDPASALFPVDEIARHVSTEVIGILRRWALTYDCSVVLVAHPSQQGQRDGSGSSGSTGWGNAVRSRLFLRRQSGKRADADVRILSVTKINYGAVGTTLPIRYAAGRFVPAATPTASEAPRQVDELFLRLLETQIAQGRRVSPHKSKTWAPSVFAKLEEARGTTAAGFETAMDRLLMGGAIRVVQYGSPSKSRSCIELVGASNR